MEMTHPISHNNQAILTLINLRFCCRRFVVVQLKHFVPLRYLFWSFYYWIIVCLLDCLSSFSSIYDFLLIICSLVSSNLFSV